MADQDNAQEKTEQATPKRLDDARRKGQVARSRELTTMLLLMVSASAIMLTGGYMGNGLGGIMTRLLMIDPRQATAPAYMGQAFVAAIQDALLALAPFLILIFLTALFAPMLMSGWVMSAESLQFKASKMSPMKGLKRMFSVTSLVELAKAVAKFFVVMGVAILIIWQESGDVMRLGLGSSLEGVYKAMELLGWSFLLISSATILIALIDVPYQLWSHAKKLRMSFQEIKDEMKETDGNPEIKKRVRQAQQEITGRRMMEAVPAADVVIVNPTHYSVALKYDPKKDGAPILVAIGADHLAFRIREVAKANDVPIVSSPALARSLYRFGKLDQEIPSGLFVAVAQILAFIFQVRKRPGRANYAAKRFRDLTVPDDLKYDP